MARLLLEHSAIGAHGCKIVTGTEAVSVSSKTYYAVQFITDCRPTAFTMSDSDGTFSGVTYKAGTVVYGDILTITGGAGETYILYKN